MAKSDQSLKPSDLLRKYGSIQRAAAELGISRSTLRDRFYRERAGAKISPTNELKQLRRELAEAQTQADTAARIRETIYNLAAHTPEPPKWLTAPKKVSEGDRGVPLTVWSDWHYGEVVRAQEVSGMNRFNKTIAETRIHRLVDKTIDLCFNHMGKTKIPYPGIVVCLGGDMISGDIHHELEVTNDQTPYQAVNSLTDILAAALTRLADKFGRVFVPCVVGNHGRGTQYPRMKSRVFTSFEWNIYCNLERYFAKDKRLSFMIPEESDAYFSVVGHRFLLTHGDSLGVRGGDGIIGSIGPIMRGALKVSKSESQIGRDFDTIIMGHWHQYITLPGLIVNNSLKGYDEYARLALRAPYSRPSQALCFVHPKHGITAHWQIYLEEAPRHKSSAHWVSVLKRENE